MEWITAIFSALSTIATNFGTFLVAIFQSIVALFFTPGVGEASGELTFLGVILLISVVATLIFWAFRLIVSLVGRIGGKR